MRERKQDAITREFLFSLMEDVVEEDTRHLRQSGEGEARKKAEMGHMDAALSVMMTVARDSVAVPKKPKTTSNWAQNVLERVDALPAEAKPTKIRKVKRRAVANQHSELGELAQRASEQSELPAQLHGHREAPLPQVTSANKKKRMRKSAKRRKFLLRR